MLNSRNRHAIALNLLGRVALVSADDPSVLEDVAACFSSTALAKELNPGSYDLQFEISSRDAFRVRTKPESALQAIGDLPLSSPLDLCSALTHWAVSMTPGRYVLHSGGVVRDGKAMLLPGNSHSGKSTLTAGLLARGFALASDEVAAVDMRNDELTSYPRLMSIREDVIEFLQLKGLVGTRFTKEGVRFVHPHDLGSQFASTTPVRRIVFPVYDSGAKTKLHEVSSGSALVSLIESSCSQKQYKTEGLDWALGFATRTPCRRLVFSSLEDALDLLLQFFEKGDSK